jgi:hypothetical protein
LTSNFPSFFVYWPSGYRFSQDSLGIILNVGWIRMIRWFRYSGPPRTASQDQQEPGGLPILIHWCKVLGNLQILTVKADILFPVLRNQLFAI